MAKPLNVIYSTHTRPDYMPPISVSERQIIVGPGYPPASVNGVVKSVNVPYGRYDLASVVQSLPSEQSPDLTVVLAGAEQACWPTNLEAVPGKKLLLAADTHHGKYPLQSVLGYAREQPFDAIVVTHDPHHLHWFVEAGIAPTTYMPNINACDFHLPFDANRDPVIVFVGSVGRFHPRRRAVLEAIAEAGLPLRIERAPAAAAAALYNSHQITINISLNGDLNMRVFEALSAGAFLITDRLTRQAGLDQLFDRDKDYVDFGSIDELIEKLRFYLSSPAECLNIARSGQAAYLRKYGESGRRRDLMNFALGGTHSLPFGEPRAETRIDGFGQRLPERIRAYEFLQERAIAAERTDVLADAGLGARTLADLVDLPRVHIRVHATSRQRAELAKSLELLGVTEQIDFIPSIAGPYDVQIRAADALGLVTAQDAALAPRLAVVAEDAAIAPHWEHLQSLGLSRVGGRSWLFRHGV